MYLKVRFGKPSKATVHWVVRIDSEAVRCSQTHSAIFHFIIFVAFVLNAITVNHATEYFAVTL